MVGNPERSLEAAGYIVSMSRSIKQWVLRLKLLSFSFSQQLVWISANLIQMIPHSYVQKQVSLVTLDPINTASRININHRRGF